MSKHVPKGFVSKWSALGAGTKAAVIVSASIVVVSGISLPIYLNHQNQQALILAEQQEQERLAAEQAEAERTAAEERTRLEQEAETDRLAAEEEAARLEAERVQQERLAAEEKQARLEAEAQAEAERIAAEEAVAVERARQQADDATQQQAAANQNSSDDNVIPNTNAANESNHPGNGDSGTQRQYREEPTSGEGYEMAQRVGAVWDPELEGWVYIDIVGNRRFIYYSGGSKVLYD